MLTVCLEETKTRKLCVGLFDILMNMLKFKYCVPFLLAFCCITILCMDVCVFMWVCVNACGCVSFSDLARTASKTRLLLKKIVLGY